MPARYNARVSSAAQKTKILRFADNLWYFGEGMFGPLLAVFAQRIGGDILDISWAWAIYLIVCGFFMIIFGKLADKMGSEILLVTGYYLNALFTLGYLFVQTPASLFLVEAGLGIAAAMATPTWDALYDRYSDGRHRGYLWGLSDGQAQLVTGIAIVLGGFIVQATSFTALFSLMAFVQLCAALYQTQLLLKK